MLWAVSAPFAGVLVVEAVAAQFESFPLDMVKELGGLGAFFILVFLIGRRLYGSTDKLTDKVVHMAGKVSSMETAIETNTTAQNRVAAALEAFAGQQVVAQQATVASQNQLADRNLKESMAVLLRIDAALLEVLRKLADQRRGARGHQRRRSDR
jgi:hypothetical protein